MTGPSSRRGFLRSLTTLPLIGGGVSLVGEPSAVAIEPTPVMIEAYSAWLHNELDALNDTFHPRLPNGDIPRAICMLNEGAQFHGRERRRLAATTGGDGWALGGLAAQRRAALVLSTVGCGWAGRTALYWPPSSPT